LGAERHQGFYTKYYLKEDKMPRENIDFAAIVKEVFEPVFKEYGFKPKNEAVWDGRGEDVFTAAKQNMELNFYLSWFMGAYSCSVGLRLLGELAEKATPYSDWRDMDVTVLAERLNPSFKRTSKDAQTHEEVKALLEEKREVLLKYCSDILKGDVSSWTAVAAQMAEESEIDSEID
jgi:hypothetical protein